MIILIAPENDITNEIEILHELFQEGLQYYHLRKPLKSYDEHCEYLNAINTKYHNRIVTHYFHELVNVFDLKGIHFYESKRREILDANQKIKDKTCLMESYAESLNIQSSILCNKSVSSSFHEPEALETCEVDFDYHLLSPVFSSISKQGYKGREFDVNHIDKQIIGMGGVTTKNLNEFTKLGFKGVGVLGGIWESQNPITDFKLMQNYFTKLNS